MGTVLVYAVEGPRLRALVGLRVVVSAEGFGMMLLTSA